MCIRRLIKGSVLGVTWISLLTLVSLSPQAQSPQKNSDPKAKIVVGKEATPSETEVRQQPVREPQPLPLEERRRLFRSVINSLAEQSKLYPGQNLDKDFSPSVWKPNFDVLPSPPTLTVRRPWINKVGWLDFHGPEFVGKNSYQGKEHYLAAWHNSGTGKLTVNLNAAQGTYLLDFSVSAVQPLKIVEGAPASLSMMIDITQGHLLVPLLAPKAGWYEITISCPGCLGWEFFSVEIDQIK